LALGSLLSRFFGPRRHPTAYKIESVADGLSSLQSAVATLATEVADLRTKVDGLDALQVDREIAWKETRDKLLRYLKRVQELDRRENGGDDESRESANPRTAQIAAILGMKFPKKEG
jgi:hypothetical protein